MFGLLDDGSGRTGRPPRTNVGCIVLGELGIPSQEPLRESLSRAVQVCIEESTRQIIHSGHRGVPVDGAVKTLARDRAAGEALQRFGKVRIDVQRTRVDH